jgi:hypothetical protein
MVLILVKDYLLRQLTIVDSISESQADYLDGNFSAVYVSIWVLLNLIWLICARLRRFQLTWDECETENSNGMTIETVDGITFGRNEAFGFSQ